MGIQFESRCILSARQLEGNIATLFAVNEQPRGKNWIAAQKIELFQPLSISTSGYKLTNSVEIAIIETVDGVLERKTMNHIDAVLPSLAEAKGYNSLKNRLWIAIDNIRFTYFPGCDDQESKNDFYLEIKKIMRNLGEKISSEAELLKKINDHESYCVDETRQIIHRLETLDITLSYYQSNVDYLVKIGKLPIGKCGNIDRDGDKLGPAYEVCGTKVPKTGYPIAQVVPLLRQTWNTLQLVLRDDYYNLLHQQDLLEQWNRGIQTPHPTSRDLLATRLLSLIENSEKRYYILMAIHSLGIFYKNKWSNDMAHPGIPELLTLEGLAKKDCSEIFPFEKTEAFCNKHIKLFSDDNLQKVDEKLRALRRIYQECKGSKLIYIE